MVIGPDRVLRAEPSPPIGLVPSGVEGQRPPDQRESVPPLTLPPDSPPLGSPKVRAGFGTLGAPTRFGVNGRRTILRCGGVFSACKVPPSEVLFLTGTLPGGTFEAKLAIARYSSCIVKALKTWLSKWVPDAWSLYVWELQKRGALHLHYAVWVPEESVRAHILSAFHAWWYRRMELLCDESGTDVFAWESGTGTWRGRPDVVQAKAEICRKCPSSYIAKYASKAEGKADHGETPGDMGSPWPVQWWGVSRPLQAKCRELSYVTEVTDLSRKELQDVKERLERLIDGSYWRPHETEARDSGEFAGPAYQYRSRCGGIRVAVLYGDIMPEYEASELLGIRGGSLSWEGGSGQSGSVANAENRPTGSRGGDVHLEGVVEALGLSGAAGHSSGGAQFPGVEGVGRVGEDAPSPQFESVQLCLGSIQHEAVGQGGGALVRRAGGRAKRPGAGKKGPVRGGGGHSCRLVGGGWAGVGAPHYRDCGRWMTLPQAFWAACRMGPRPH